MHMHVFVCAYSSGVKWYQGVGVFESKEKIFRSGIVHHMVIVKKVLDDMFTTAERLHGGMPFWKVGRKEYSYVVYVILVCKTVLLCIISIYVIYVCIIL